MDKVPTMISTKDLAYLEDMFEWHFTAAKKALHYSNEVQDQEIKETFLNVYQMHKDHTEKVLSILE